MLESNISWKEILKAARVQPTKRTQILIADIRKSAVHYIIFPDYIMYRVYLIKENMLKISKIIAHYLKMVWLFQIICSISYVGCNNETVILSSKRNRLLFSNKMLLANIILLRRETNILFGVPKIIWAMTLHCKY